MKNLEECDIIINEIKALAEHRKHLANHRAIHWNTNDPNYVEVDEAFDNIIEKEKK